MLLGVTVTVSDADFVLSATEVAVTVTVRFAVTGAGGVYMVGAPLAVLAGLSVPQAVAEQVAIQSTPPLVGSFATVAVMERVCPSANACGVLGESVTKIGGGRVTLTLSDADFVGSVPEVAVTVIARVAVTVAGAV